MLDIDTLQRSLYLCILQELKVSIMATNLATSTARRSQGGTSFPLPSVVNHKSAKESKKIGVLPGKMMPFDPQILLTRIAAGKSVREHQAEDSIFLQGDPADAVFYILTGKVKLTVVSTSGKEAVIAYLPEKSFFGEGAIAGQQLRISTASALQSCTIVRIEKTVMLGLLQREPEFSEQFLSHLLSRNLRMEADLVDHLFNSSEKRLARLLLMMANIGEDSKPVPAIAKISQETLAEMIGTTRSRVSFFLNRFRDLGFINYNSSGMNVNRSLSSVVAHD
jgi:CRP-like cAMP-binding protein